MKIIVTLFLLTVNSSADDLKGSLSIRWNECKLVKGSMEPGQDKVEVVAGDPVEMRCIKSKKTIVCDYLGENGKPKNQPSTFSVEHEGQDFCFASNESNSTRLHFNTKSKRAILKSNIFVPTLPDQFGIKFCVGYIRRD
jgi:hypothetical protein